MRLIAPGIDIGRMPLVSGHCFTLSQRIPGTGSGKIGKPMFSLFADPSKKLITARMSGFLTVNEVQSFSRQVQDAVKAMGCRSGEFLLLTDTDGAVIQSQEVVAAFRLLVSASSYRARRIAVVRHDAITRFQTRRILADRDDTAIFETTNEAMAWLFTE